LMSEVSVPVVVWLVELTVKLPTWTVQLLYRLGFAATASC
jgi:hypothetical protein